MGNCEGNAAPERLLTIQEVARRLTISTKTVRKLASTGRLPQPVRLGRAVRWRATDVDLFLRLDCDMRRFVEVRSREGGAP